MRIVWYDGHFASLSCVPRKCCFTPATNQCMSCALQEAIAAKLVSKANLGYLLWHLCGIGADKSLALSDWRQRPLPQALLNYAALDVLHLQVIASKLVNMLLSTGGPLPLTALANDAKPPEVFTSMVSLCML